MDIKLYNMKYLKYIKEHSEEYNKEDLRSMFNLVMRDVELIKVPYSYYGDVKNVVDFYIYVISGNRIESDDHKLVQDLYHNHGILNELYNLEFFKISLSSSYVTIVLYDYRDGYSKNYMSSNISEYKLPLPSNIKSRLRFSSNSNHVKVLHRGIDWSGGGSSNLALFDWVYK